MPKPVKMRGTWDEAWRVSFVLWNAIFSDTNIDVLVAPSQICQEVKAPRWECLECQSFPAEAADKIQYMVHNDSSHTIWLGLRSLGWSRSLVVAAQSYCLLVALSPGRTKYATQSANGWAPPRNMSICCPVCKHELRNCVIDILCS